MSGAWQVVLNGVIISGGGDVDGSGGFGLGPFGLGPFGGGFGSVGGYLSTPPEGMGKPGLRVEDQSMPQRDGTRMFADWYEPRIVTLDEVSVPPSGTCDPASAARRARMLTEAWDRHCGEVELVVFTDATGTAERELVGPFGVRGRPRVAEITWLPGPKRIGMGTFRFDAVDHRLYVLDEDGTPGSGGETFELDLQLRPYDTPQYGPNLVANPSFETAGPASWTLANMSRVTTKARTGVASIRGTGLGTADATSANFTVIPGRLWRVEAYATKGSSSTGDQNVEVGVEFIGQPLDPANFTTWNARGTKWKKGEVSGVVPAGVTQARIISSVGGLASGFPWLDDVSFVQETVPPPPPVPEEVAISGSLCTPVTITFTGPLLYPRLSLEDGDFVEWAADLGAGDVVVIDTETGIGTLNDLENNELVGGNPFLNIPDGVVELSFSSLDASDSGTIEVYYRPAVISA